MLFTSLSLTSNSFLPCLEPASLPAPTSTSVCPRRVGRCHGGEKRAPGHLQSWWHLGLLNFQVMKVEDIVFNRGYRGFTNNNSHLMAFYSDLMAFYSDLMAFYSDLMAFYSDLMAFDSDSMGFYSDSMGFYSDLLGY